MISGIDIEMAEEYFDDLDCNNQRNYLWDLVDMARAHESGLEYDWDKESPYKHTVHVDTLPKMLGSEKLSKMAKKLTMIGFGRPTKLQELMEAAA